MVVVVVVVVLEEEDSMILSCNNDTQTRTRTLDRRELRHKRRFHSSFSQRQ